ncbi:MAG: DUF58 domain-containing protein [Fibrobacteres bacterium]|nr:DUF58 domain-containing protein [Fibrobacterota bacterium]
MRWRAGTCPPSRAPACAFREVRAYPDGDDPRGIDSTSRPGSNEPFVKVFEEERELTAAFLLDLSATTLAGAEAASCEAAGEFCVDLASSCLGSQEASPFSPLGPGWNLGFRRRAAPRSCRACCARSWNATRTGAPTGSALACDQLARQLRRMWCCSSCPISRRPGTFSSSPCAAWASATI